MIIISPYAQKLRNGNNNPKNYPYWDSLIILLKQVDPEIVQVGIKGEEPLVADTRFNLSLDDLTKLVKQCDTWIGVDSFFQHFCWDLNKPGIVIWGQSDPNIFGHPENINLLLDRKYLRKNQFHIWEQCEYRTDCFVDPHIIINKIHILLKDK
jgi:ADP-heptose:LPS heptosyltransferase